MTDSENTIFVKGLKVIAMLILALVVLCFVFSAVISWFLLLVVACGIISTFAVTIVGIVRVLDLYLDIKP